MTEVDDILVFDVGGTSVRAGLYSARSDRLRRVQRRATPGIVDRTDESGDVIRARLYETLQGLALEVAGQARPGVVAVAFPGPVDRAGRVLHAPTVWGESRSAEPVPVRRDLSRLWPGSRVVLLNDMTAAGYNYLDRPTRDLCVLTVSSGIGHKVFVDGRPLIGESGRGGELGHLRVDFSQVAPLCDCGGRGHLGAVASGRAVRHHLQAMLEEDPEGYEKSLLAGRLQPGRHDDNVAIAQSFVAGDPWTERLIRRIATPLGRVIAAIHLAVGVERFVVTGGFAVALGGSFRRLLSETAAESAWDLGQNWDRMIELTGEGDEACLRGAGRFASRYFPGADS